MVVIYHVDDSSVARRSLSGLITKSFPEAKLIQFESAVDLLHSLNESLTPIPNVILSDIGMSGLTGLELLDRLKSSPKYHRIPVVMVTAEGTPETKKHAKASGAGDFLIKPVEPQALKDAISRIMDSLEALGDTRKLDLAFVEELKDQSQQMSELAKTPSENALKEIYHVLHTIKGSARVLEFMQVAHFAHQCENFLQTIQSGKLYNAPNTTTTLLHMAKYFEHMADLIQLEVDLPAPSQELLDEFLEAQNSIKNGWVNINMPPNETQTPSGDFLRSSNSVRISHEKIDELQSRFKKIQQIRVKLNSFLHQLQAEFPDETFPNQLASLTQELEQTSFSIMDFFFELRARSVLPLKEFATRIVDQALSGTGRKIAVLFESDEFLEVDQAILSCLETSLTHLLRNSIDHGFESISDRQKVDKPSDGQIRITIKRQSKDSIFMDVTDDGRGIDAKIVASSVLKKGILTEETLANMKENDVLNLIFLDGFSTRDEVGETSGRGVGLSAVKKAITDLGGRIQVTSRLGLGTLFHIELPKVFQL